MTQSSLKRPSFSSPSFPRRLSLRAKLIIGFSLIAAVVSLITAFAVYTTTQRQITENFRRRVLTAAAITALQQNGDEFETIASASDPLYEEFRLQNLAILRSDPDFIFVYTMRKDELGIYFVVDGNEPDAEGFSVYGERYLEPSPLLTENFDSMSAPIVEPEIYTDEYGSFLSAYAPIRTSDGRQVGVIGVDITADTILQEQRQIIIQAFFIFLIVFAIGTLLGNLAGSALARPVSKLAQSAQAFTTGKFDQRVDIHTGDEIGDLANTFNSMADEIQSLIGSLEKRVEERTRDLEAERQQSEKHARELVTVGEISKLINSEQRLENLLSLITRLVSERFGFYHVGIFMVDESRQFAILQAANSEGGRNMLKREHKLRVGESGIVGYVAKFGAPRIALDVGLDAVFFNNPDLPNTRSEMALPLKLRDEVIGVLDVQSEEPGIFTDEDANTLGILADQIAIAIENARLFAKTRESLSELQSMYRQNLQEGWRTFIREEAAAGYHQSVGGGKKLTQPITTDEIQEAMYRGDVMQLHADGKTQESILVVPIKLRGQVIGVMRVKAPTKDRQWTGAEVNLAEAVSERLSLALDNARLLQESQRRAIKERTISEITGKIGSSINLENVLLTAVEELGRTIPGSEVIINLQNENSLEGSE
ncbi:MAG: GAF domain-containing protein [Anaerolineales bacterium]|nr:GAF domain-containing protein [Anaerolineales bacterium]WKZ38783.1 MAG: GAF domain-containing protein [Anaerolineales bacterium]